MKSFSDFASNELNLRGEKISIEDVVNKKIAIYAFRTMPSKYDKGNDCIQIQFRFIDDNGVEASEDRVIFTGSTVLIKELNEYKEHLPFATTIKRERNRYYTLT